MLWRKSKQNGEAEAALGKRPLCAGWPGGPRCAGGPDTGVEKAEQPACSITGPCRLVSRIPGSSPAPASRPGQGDTLPPVPQAGPVPENLPALRARGLGKFLLLTPIRPAVGGASRGGCYGKRLSWQEFRSQERLPINLQGPPPERLNGPLWGMLGTHPWTEVLLQQCDRFLSQAYPPPGMGQTLAPVAPMSEQDPQPSADLSG